EQLEQIFWNLFKNSLEAVDNCGDINISSQIVDSNTPVDSASPENIAATGTNPIDNKPISIKIRICDNGSGISDEIAQEIFEPFFTTKATGTGLGLYIAFQLTRVNNGNIQLGKREDNRKGTCAQISFPAAN
ncbi:MAG: hypothetical protein DRH03_03395, partial [Deltaproteobacteria bacterium]